MNRLVLLASMALVCLMSACSKKVCKIDRDVVGSVIPGSAEDFATNVPNKVFFNFDSSEVLASAKQRIEAQSRWLNTYQQKKAIVEGHTDSRGTSEYNMALSARRANAVSKELKKLGVDDKRISVVPYGKTRLESDEASEEAHARNRRAVTVID